LKRAPSDSSPIAIISKDINESNIKNDNITNVFDRNPLERLCEVMTNWNILNDVITGNSFNNQEDHVPSLTSRIETIPTIFESCAKYYNTWEPLLIDEIKANICANLVHNTRNSSKTGKLIIGMHIISFL
jgi:hypothetical protein